MTTMRPSLPLASAVILALLAGCGADRTPEISGPTDAMITAAAKGSGVPRDLMVAVAHIEGGLGLASIREVESDEAVPVAGVLELRHGRYNSLARGAALMGLSEMDLQIDLSKGTEAGARVLDDLARVNAIPRADLAAWAEVVEELSGHRSRAQQIAYRAEVFHLLRNGGAVRARGGESIVIPAHEEIPIELTWAPPPLQAQGTPEYPGAIWFETPQANKWTPGRESPITMIAIHDTEGGWNASVSTLQNDSGKSVHYILSADGGKVGQFIAEGDTGWHVGNWFYNTRMIGIEHVGYAGLDDYQTSLYEKSADLVRSIAKRNKLGPHKDGTDLDRSVLVFLDDILVKPIDGEQFRGRYVGDFLNRRETFLDEDLRNLVVDFELVDKQFACRLLLALALLANLIRRHHIELPTRKLAGQAHVLATAANRLGQLVLGHRDVHRVLFFVNCTSAGAIALMTNWALFSFHKTMSMRSPLSSFETACTRDPRMPIQAPIGSVR